MGSTTLSADFENLLSILSEYSVGSTYNESGQTPALSSIFTRKMHSIASAVFLSIWIVPREGGRPAVQVRMEREKMFIQVCRLCAH